LQKAFQHDVRVLSGAMRAAVAWPRRPGKSRRRGPARVQIEDGDAPAKADGGPAGSSPTSITDRRRRSRWWWPEKAAWFG
jgi:hypothetical protein